MNKFYLLLFVPLTMHPAPWHTWSGALFMVKSTSVIYGETTKHPSINNISKILESWANPRKGLPLNLWGIKKRFFCFEVVFNYFFLGGFPLFFEVVFHFIFWGCLPFFFWDCLPFFHSWVHLPVFKKFVFHFC